MKADIFSYGWLESVEIRFPVAIQEEETAGTGRSSNCATAADSGSKPKEYGREDKWASASQVSQSGVSSRIVGVSVCALIPLLNMRFLVLVQVPTAFYFKEYILLGFHRTVIHSRVNSVAHFQHNSSILSYKILIFSMEI